MSLNKVALATAGTATSPQSRPFLSRALPRILDGLAITVVIASLLTVARCVFVLYTVGGNCIGNDYIHWIGAIDSALSGNFNWAEYARTMFMGSHYCFFSVLIELAMCKLAIWDVRLECLLGLTMLMTSTCLMWSALTERNMGRWRYLIFAALVAINFGTSQYSVLLHSMFGLRLTGLCQLGFAIGIWSLIKLGDKRPVVAVCLTGLGGVLASYSNGAALPLWTALFSLMAFRRCFDRAAYALFAAFAGLGMFPYAYFLLARTPEASKFAYARTGSMDPLQLLDLIGRPLCNGIGQDFGKLQSAEIAGTFGIVFFVSMLVCWTAKKLPIKTLAPALSLIVFSIVAACLLLSLRTQIAPWYAVLAKYFWIGFIVVAVNLLHVTFARGGFNLPRTSKNTIVSASIASISIASSALTGWLALYLMTNWSYSDKHFYLNSRSPASESAQRHYQTAPTYAEDLLFQWGAGNQELTKLLGMTLKKHELLCFGPHQEWALQGDYFLSTVSMDREKQEPRWVDGNRIDRMRLWRDYHHVNLALPSDQHVSWTVSIPAHAKDAVLNTKCMLGAERGRTPTDSSSNLVSINIEAKNSEHAQAMPADHSRVTRFNYLIGNSIQKPIQIPLQQFAGQTIKLTFACRAMSNDASSGWAIFEYPKINLEQPAQVVSAVVASVVVPENTDLSPRFPALTQRDLVLNMVPTNHPSLNCNNLRIRDYSYVYVRAVAGGVARPVLYIDMSLADGTTNRIALPLLQKKSEHGYTYDLRLLHVLPGTRLRDITITPGGQTKLEESRTIINEVRFIR